MVFSRTALRLGGYRNPSIRASIFRAPTPLISLRSYAHSGYGDGKGDPKAEDPRQQGSNPSADLEHPGPPPVQEGQGSGSTPTKGSGKGHNSSSGSSSSGATSTSGASSGENKSDSSGAQPKIHDDRSGPSNTKEDVEQHNREFEQRHDRASNKGDDTDHKVDKKFWKGTFGVIYTEVLSDRVLGQGGADRQP